MKILTEVTKYRRTWFKVVLGVSWRFLMWKQKHVTLINPKLEPSGHLPSGEYPLVTAIPYDLEKLGQNPEKVERLVNVEGYGIIDEDDCGKRSGDISADLKRAVSLIFDSLDAVPLRGEYIRQPGDRVVPLAVLLLGTDQERQARRLAINLDRQAAALKEPTSYSELYSAAVTIVSRVNSGVV